MTFLDMVSKLCFGLYLIFSSTYAFLVIPFIIFSMDQVILYPDHYIMFIYIRTFILIALLAAGIVALSVLHVSYHSFTFLTIVDSYLLFYIVIQVIYLVNNWSDSELRKLSQLEIYNTILLIYILIFNIVKQACTVHTLAGKLYQQVFLLGFRLLLFAHISYNYIYEIDILYLWFLPFGMYLSNWAILLSSISLHQVNYYLSHDYTPLDDEISIFMSARNKLRFINFSAILFVNAPLLTMGIITLEYEKLMPVSFIPIFVYIGLETSCLFFAFIRPRNISAL